MSKHKHSVGNTSSRVSPPLGHLPDFEIKPLSPRSGVDSSPAKGSSIEVTDGTPAACYQKNAEDYLQGDVSTSVMAQYGQQLFGAAQHTHSAHPAPDEDEFLRIERIPFDTMVQRIMDGEITDAKTVATVLKTKVRLHL